MNYFSSPVMLAGLAVGVVVGLILRYFIFRASCALVDVDPSPLKSVLIVLVGLAVALVIGVPLFGLPLGLIGQPLFNVQEYVSWYVVWCVVGVVLIWAILGALYIPAVPVSVGKGFLLSAYEIVLGLLANALVLGVILFIYALIQIGNTSAPNPGRTELPAATPAPAARAS